MMRLLPQDPAIGWTPYVWLIYLGIFASQPMLTQGTAAEWIVTLLGMAVFVPLYFRGFWLRGRRLLPIIVAIDGLGFLYSPSNYGASVFFIYAAAFVGEVGPPRVAIRLLGVHLVFVATTALAFGSSPQTWIPGIVFSLLIGGVNIQFAESRRRASKLQMAHEEVERLATVAERERIARDLHDLLGHSLSMITLKSELAAKLASVDPARAAREMREVESASRQALAEVRRTVQGYREQTLGVELAKACLALETAGVSPRVDRGPFRLPPTIEDAVAFALREGVTNVVRHAGANECRIAYRQAHGRFRLEIEDDGRGLGTTPERMGAGLAGMRERIAACGGRLDVESQGRGTRLRVEIPLEGQAPALVDDALQEPVQCAS